MKLILNSKQNYGTHIEEYTEEFNCSVEKNGNIIKIDFDDGTILIEENKIIYKRNENKIIIEPGKTNECDYETEHGMFVLDIKGISIEISNEAQEEIEAGKIATAVYEIQIVGVTPYENTIEITLKE